MQKLSEEAKKNKNEYIKKYKKEKTKQIAVSFNLDEYDEFAKRYAKLKGKTTQKEILLLGLEEMEKRFKK